MLMQHRHFHDADRIRSIFASKMADNDAIITEHRMPHYNDADTDANADASLVPTSIISVKNNENSQLKR